MTHQSPFRKGLICLSQIFILTLLLNVRTQAQYYIPSPPVAFDTFISLPGRNLAQITDSLRALLDPSDSEEGGPTDDWKTFSTIWKMRVTANDSSGENMFMQFHRALTEAAGARLGSPCGTAGYQGAWATIGPDSLPTQTTGKVDVVWASPTNENHVLAGGQGGLFETFDGGKNWNCITDNSPYIGSLMGIKNICVNPLRDSTIYLGTGQVPGGTTDMGAGILKSFDGGATWQQELILYTGSYLDTMEPIKVFMTPDSMRLYAFIDRLVFTRYNVGTGNTWHDITPSTTSIPPIWSDIQFVPGNRHHFFISGIYGHNGIWESTDSMGSSWNEITSGFSPMIETGTYAASNLMSQIRISMPDTDTLFTFMRANDEHASIYKYALSSTSFYIVKNDVPNYSGDYQKSRSKGEFVVSGAGRSNNAGRRNIYYGWDVPFQSWDGGYSFHPIGDYPANYTTHGDVRCIYLQRASNTIRGDSDVLFIATDGGVSKKFAGADDSLLGAGDATVDISGKGLVCGTFWSYSTSEQGGLGIGGMMHDGVANFEQALPQKWANYSTIAGATDAWGATVDKSNPSCAWFWYVWYAFDATGSLSGRTMGTIGGYTVPTIDPVFSSFMVAPPTDVDNSGTYYYVANQVYRRDPGYSTFYVADYLGFPNDGGLEGAQLAFAPQDTSYTGYILYNSYGTNAPHIYYRIPSISLVAHETLSQVPTVDAWSAYHFATGLTADATNINRVWVSQNGVSFHNYTTTRFRVQFSPDHGTTWIDVSNGLPQRIPMTKIIYDEATGILYGATEAGLYKCDFNNYRDDSTTLDGSYYYNNSVEWTCFSQGLVAGHDFPNVGVTDLRINHCEGKLYAATYGRGIWATDLNPPNTVLNPNTLVTSDTTWAIGGHNWYITGSVDVKPGATLTITNGDTVNMPKGATIIVEPGAHLIVDSAEIRNLCDGCFWAGIRAVGQTFVPQMTANQGWVTITHRSTIQDADMALTNCDLPIYWGHTGGILQAFNSRFINNHNSVYMEVYDNWGTDGLIHDNLSHFTNCTFDIDNNYKGNKISYPMTSHVYLHDVEGVKFTANNFYNHDTFRINRLKGNGIYSKNAGFSIGGYCGSITSPCATTTIHPKFNGLTNGIRIDRGVYDPPIKIDDARFDSVSIGVNNYAANNVVITNCVYTVGNGLGIDSLMDSTFLGCNQNIGILHQNSSQFVVEGNTFTGVPHSGGTWYNIGVAVANSGTADNTVYRNTIGDSLTVGVCAAGKNEGSSSSGAATGLTILCNAFSNNGTDILVTKDETTVVSQGICTIQAKYPASLMAPAGNTFSGSTNNIINNAGSFIYYYDQLNPSTEEPMSVHGSDSAFTFISFFNARKSCDPSTPAAGELPGPAGGHPMAALRAHKANFRKYQAQLDDSATVYNSRIDYGNTDSLADVIVSSTDTAALYTILANRSPYISKYVLKVTGDNGVLPYTSMMKILKKNPDNLRDSRFIDVMTTDYSLSSDDIDTLQTAATVNTQRTAIETKMFGYQAAMSEEGTIIITALKSSLDTNVAIMDTTGAGLCTDSTSLYYGLDSNAYHVEADSVDTWLQNIGGIWSQYERWALYNWQGNYGTADTMMTTIGQHLPADATDSATYNTYAAVWSVLYGAVADGRNQWQLHDDEIATLDSLGGTGLTYNTGKLLAYSLSHTGVGTVGAGTQVTPWPCLDETLSEGKHGSTTRDNPILPDNVNSKEAGAFNAYPNPTKGNVTFAYNVAGAGSEMTIRITNIVGEDVKLLYTAGPDKAGGVTGSLVWDTNGQPAGMYFYSASCAKGVVSKGKLVVVR